MKPQNITVTCEHGLPLSIASQVSAIARKSGLAVTIQCEDCPQIDACSVFQMLSLGASDLGVGGGLVLSAQYAF